MAHAAFTHSPSFDVMLEHSRRFEYTDRAPLQVKASLEAVTLLAGPFTVGPGEWISTVFAIPPLLQYGDRIAAFTGDAVDAKGQVIPYPPMHLHHIHVAHGHSTHSYETHGDYATMKSMGTRGYTTSSAPQCRRVPCGEPLTVNAQLNDVRAGSSGMAGHVASGGRAYRPSVINCYSGADLSTVAKWYVAWTSFIFDAPITTIDRKTGVPNLHTVASVLTPIKRSKYPAISEAEAKISVPLQTLTLAIFDAILVHIVNTLGAAPSSTTPFAWQPLRSQICSALNLRKTARTIEILGSSYNSDADVIFLQVNIYCLSSILLLLYSTL